MSAHKINSQLNKIDFKQLNFSFSSPDFASFQTDIVKINLKKIQEIQNIIFLDFSIFSNLNSAPKNIIVNNSK